MERKPKTRTIIVSDTDEECLGRIAEAYPLVASHRLCQVALKFGLRTLAGEPGRVVEEAARDAREGAGDSGGGQ